MANAGTTHRSGRSKVVALWTWTLICVLSGPLVLFLLNRGDNAQPNPVPPDAPLWFQSLLLAGFGVFIVVVGIVTYVVCLQTNCFTFDFRQPIWKSAKLKLYVANLAVQLILVLGLSLVAISLFRPLLASAGIHGELAWLIPLGGAIATLTFLGIWVNIWTPVTKRLITRRLAAKGIRPDQMQLGMSIGISDPTRSDFKKLILEDDIGMLWIDPQRAVYFGDQEHFSFTPSEVVGAERKIQTGSVMTLAGATYLILQVRLPTGGERPIRLHVENAWTLGQKRVAMDALSAQIEAWLQAARG